MLDMYATDNGKIVVKVPIEYSVFDTVEMEFESIEDMRQKLNDSNFVEEMPLGEDPTYIDGSYMINFDYMEDELEQPIRLSDEHQTTEGEVL